MNKYLALLFFLFCTGCYKNSPKTPFKVSAKERVVTRVEKKVISNLKEKYGLISAGTGGQMMYQVEKLMLIFNYPEPLTETEASELVINAVEDFLFAINQEEELRQYLANYPFKPENVEITIFLQDTRGRSVHPDKFISVKAANGYVVFKAKDSETKEYRVVLKEPFEEVKAKCFINAFPKVG